MKKKKIINSMSSNSMITKNVNLGNLGKRSGGGGLT
jgi:hypothetical protein